MNLFIIPSWYPSPASPLSGTFTKEQAEAIADISNGTNVIMSTWGHDFTALPVRKPLVWIEKILWVLRQPKNHIKKVNGVHEVFNAQLQWNERLPFGGIKQLIKVNRKNFKAAMDRFGKIDIIHAHVSFPAGYIARELSKEFNVPYVVTEHMGPFPFVAYMNGDQPRKEIVEALNNANVSIAVSPSLADRIASFNISKPQVIGNIVDERRFSVAKLPTDKFVFFTLGGISEHKGIDHLIQAIAKWKPDPKHYEFRIGGTGPMLEQYQQLAKELKVDELIKWLGSIDRNKVPKLFQECDVFVLPSRHETFGVVYAEAHACGKPVIATRCGGPEFFVNDNNGMLVDVGDIEELAESLKRIVGRHSDYDSKAIREEFETKFSRKAIVSQLIRSYKAI